VAIFDVTSKRVYFPVENDLPEGLHYSPGLEKIFEWDLPFALAPSVALPRNLYSAKRPPYVRLETEYSQQLVKFLKKAIPNFASKNRAGPVKDVGTSVRVLGAVLHYHAHLMVRGEGGWGAWPSCGGGIIFFIVILY
jgi:hypothetical protein